MSMAINGLSRRIHPGFRVTPGGHFAEPVQEGESNEAQISHGNRQRVWRGYVPIDSKHSAGSSGG